MSKIAKQVSSDLFMFIKDYFHYAFVKETINIKHINTDSVELIGPSQPLYVLRLETQDSIPILIDTEKLYNDSRNDDDATFYYFYVAKEEYRATYVASFSPDLLRRIQSICKTDHFGEPAFLSGQEIVRFIYDIFMGNDAEFDQESFLFEPTIDWDNLNDDNTVDPLFFSFSEMISERSAEIMNEYDYWQIITMDMGKDDQKYRSFAEFEGVYCAMVSVSDSICMDSYTGAKRSYAFKFDAEMRKAIDAFGEDDKINHFPKALFNGFYLSHKTKRKQTQRLANDMGAKIERHHLFTEKIVPKTIILQRDLAFNFLMPASTIRDHLPVLTYRNIDKEGLRELQERKLGGRIEFYGKDIYGTPINYSFRSNQAPHVFIGAPTGSGKSYQLIAILCMILRIDFKTKTAALLSSTKVRYFEIGYTSKRLSMMLKESHPEMVNMYESSLDKLRLSVTDVDVDSDGLPSELGMENSLITMNLILASGENSDPQISESEFGIYKEVMKRLYRDSSERSDPTLTELEREGYSVEELMLIYPRTTPISKVTEESADRFRVPTLQDLISILSRRSSSSTIADRERKTIESLIGKLSSVASNEVFSGYNDIPFKDINYQYVENDEIKESKNFPAILWNYISRFIRIDKQDAIKRKSRGEDPVPTYYIIEEATNIYKYRIFEQKFELLSKELRKYGITIISVAQKPKDIPYGILSQINNKVFISPSSEQDRISLANELEEHLQLRSGDGALDDFKEIFYNAQKFELNIMFDRGTLAMKFDFDQNIDRLAR